MEPGSWDNGSLDLRPLRTSRTAHSLRIEAPPLSTDQNPVAAESAYVRLIKPVLDRVTGMLLSIATLPLVAIISVLIHRSMGRPVFFLQQRVGRDGKPFIVFKFRTMLPDRRKAQVPFEGPDRRKVHKSPNDPRVTPLGAFLRRWSLDEVPQFWNVAMGHMSLVGPRPELVEIVETKYEPRQHRRHVVKPGVTGLWQISAQREDLMYEATAIDLAYVDSISPTTDLKILARTMPAVLGFRRS